MEFRSGSIGNGPGRQNRPEESKYIEKLPINRPAADMLIYFRRTLAQTFAAVLFKGAPEQFETIHVFLQQPCLSTRLAPPPGSK